MQVQYLELDQIIPYEFNNRTHPQQQIDRIANSISLFGFNQPIVVDESNTILVGHGRWAAAKKLGMVKAPVLLRAGLSEADKRAYRILDNKLQNDSSWDLNNLELELGFLEDNAFDLAEYGLDDLKSLFPDLPDPEVQEDDGAGALPEETYLKLGDVIELGPHKVFCADIASFDEDLSSPADMWITDPPYGVSYVGKTKDALKIQNDDLSQDGLRQLWDAATDYALRNIRVGGACYASVPAGPPSFIFFSCWLERDVFRQELCWIKDSMVLGRSDYHYKHEPILYGWKPGAAHFFTKDRTRVSTLEYARPKRSSEHPTMKPVELWAELIRNSSPAGGTVLDTFLGSGTTLIAADQLNRICYGMEISPKYCQVILERYQKHCAKVGKPFHCKINGEVFSG